MKIIDAWDSPVRKSGLISQNEYASLSWAAVSYADFTRTGEYSIVINTYDATKAEDGRAANNGQVLMLDQFGNNLSDQYMVGDRTGCMHPRKSLVADFNNDEMPDVFFACHGDDTIVGGGTGEQSRILISDAVTKKYAVKLVSATDVNGYAHGGAAADIDGDGNVDVVLADFKYAGSTLSLRVILGTGTGEFVNDTSRIDLTKILNKEDVRWENYFSVELIPVSGELYMYAGGGDDLESPDISAVPNIEAKFVNGFIDYESVKILPGLKGTVLLDIVRSDSGKLYVIKVPLDYSGMIIQEINEDRSRGEIVFTSSGRLHESRHESGIPFFEIIDGKLYGLDLLMDFNLSIQ